MGLISVFGKFGERKFGEGKFNEGKFREGKFRMGKIRMGKFIEGKFRQDNTKFNMKIQYKKHYENTIQKYYM